MKILNKLSDRLAELHDNIEDCFNSLFPVFKKRKLSFGRVYYIFGAQIVIYSEPKKVGWL